MRIYAHEEREKVEAETEKSFWFASWSLVVSIWLSLAWFKSRN